MPDPLEILIVEDSSDDAELLLEELREAGFDPRWRRVQTSNEFSAALRPDLDLIFSDFTLPQFTIEKGLQLLHESALDIPFIIISGSIGEERAVESLKAGATDYLLKDRLSRLGPAVRRALDEHRERVTRKKAEASQREIEQRFGQLAENIREVFWMTDAAITKVFYISPAYEAIWGRSCQSLYDNPRDWLNAIYPDDRDRIENGLSRQVSGQYKEVFRILRPDGAVRWIRVRVYPMSDETGVITKLVGTAEDITEQRHLEAQLRQAQKLEAIGTLAGGIAHDFNNILGAIIGYADLARSECQSLPHVAEYLDHVCKAAGRAKELVKQILMFSRQQEQQRVPVQIRHVVAEALKLLRAGTPSTITFETSLARETPPVLADATQIHQIVMNLGANAAHAMQGQPGVLETTLERVVIEEQPDESAGKLKPGVYAKLSIRDTGHGMNQSVLQRIFDPFFTTKPPGEGTGLGLAVVHGIMQTHEGHVEVTSEPGKGTAFELYFPALPEGRLESVAPAEEAPHGEGQRILVVEDEEALLQVTMRVLEKLGYSVVGANNPLNALEAFQEKPGTFSLVITDLTMPGMSGFELASALHKLRPELPIIVMTGHSGTITPDDAQAVGIRELLFKPLTIQCAAEAVQRALQGATAPS